VGRTYDTDFLPVTLTVNGQDPMYFFLSARPDTL